MNTIIDDELAVLEAAEKAATPGPWVTQEADRWKDVRRENAALVLAARNALPKLIAEVRLLRRALGGCDVGLLRADRKLGEP